MNTSIELAKIIGLYFAIIAIAFLIFRKRFTNFVKEVKANPIMVYISGAKSLLLGLIVVVLHNLWALEWFVVITIVGWLLVIRGLVRIFFAERVSKWLGKLNKEAYYYTVSSIVLVVGLFLIYHGFFV